MTDDRGIEQRISLWLEAEAIGSRTDRVLDATFAHTRTTKQYVDWRARLRELRGPRLLAGLGAALVIVVVAALGLDLVSNRPGIGGPSPSPSTTPAPSSSPSTSPIAWSPVRTDANEMPVVPMDSEIDGRSGNITGNDIWHDQIDTTPEFIDITDIRWQREDQMRWSFHLSDAPPPAKALDPDAQVIEYGLVFDVDWDAVPDYEVGIDNSPGGGRYRVWVTDLKANTTEKRSGPPYGALVDFSHPDEASAPTMAFTFLDGTRPPGLDSDSRLYAWASYKEHGSVVAWDYAPDFGWLAGGPMLVMRGYTASVQRGEMATLSVMAGSRQRCYVEIIYGNDPSEVTRLEERLADQLGMLSWTWRVPADTTPGTYPLNIYCSSNAAADPFREQFEVR